MKEKLKIKSHERYTDNTALLDTNERKLRKAIEEIEKYIGNIVLKLKETYQVRKEHSRPIVLVGFSFDKVIVSNHIKK